MKKFLFLLCILATTQLFAQRIGNNVPANLKGSTIYLPHNDLAYATSLSNARNNSFAGGKIKAINSNEYFKMMTTTEGYTIVPVKEDIGDKSNIWLTLYKNSTKAVVRQADKTGFYLPDPALKPVVAIKIDPSKMGTSYDQLYLSALEALLQGISQLAPEERVAKLQSNSGMENVDILVLHDKEMQPLYNSPGKISSIHPAAVIESLPIIQKRLTKGEEGTAVLEVIEFFEEGKKPAFEARVFAANGGLIYLKTITTESGNAMVDRTLLENLLSEKHQLNKAGK